MTVKIIVWEQSEIHQMIKKFKGMVYPLSEQEMAELRTVHNNETGKIINGTMNVDIVFIKKDSNNICSRMPHLYSALKTDGLFAQLVLFHVQKTFNTLFTMESWLNDKKVCELVVNRITVNYPIGC